MIGTGLITLPTFFYLLLHLLGWYYPALLWGTDQLHYYPFSVLIGFTFTTTITLVVAARPSWLATFDQRLDRLVNLLGQRPFNTLWFKLFLLLLFFALTYAFRVREHSLGDSDKWLRALERSLAEERRAPANWITGLSTGSRGDLPTFEPLDFFLHLQAYRLGHTLFSWTPPDAYAWLSCIAGVFYVLALWRISSLLLRDRPLERLTLFALLLTLGSIQLFFGYGESYTLVTLVAAWYAFFALRALQGGSLQFPSLCLLLAIPLHAIALSLVPSWLYLLWRKKEWTMPALLQRRLVWLPLLAAGTAAGLHLYSSFYPYSLPLWHPAAEGQYSLFSLAHLMALFNEVLLLSPFGLVWGLARAFDQRSTPVCGFLGWAVLGAGGLMFFHDAFLGGRDWDLMSFPALFYTLWGCERLHLCRDRVTQAHQMCLAVLPLMCLHTALWIGINTSATRAIDRLGNLLPSANQPLHYRQFALGHYYLNIRSDPVSAIPYFRAALAQAPPAGQDSEGRYGSRYRKFLGQSLVRSGDYREGTAVLAEALSRQKSPLGDENDTLFYLSWVLGTLKLGEEQDAQGDRSGAEQLWEVAIARCQAALAGQQPLKPDAGRARIRAVLARTYWHLKKLDAAHQEHQKVSALQFDGAEECQRLAAFYADLGEPGEAVSWYQKALVLDPDNARIHNDIGVSYRALGNYERAIFHWQRAIESNPDCADAHYNLGVTYQYNLGEYDRAIHCWKETLKLQADNPDIYLHLGNAYGLLKREREARVWFDKFLELFPDHPKAGEVRRLLGGDSPKK